MNGRVVPGGPSHYEVLGVAEDADRETIRGAYLRIARSTHPDRASVDPTQRADAARTIRAANAAWNVLSDETRRRAYDLARSGLQTSSAPRSVRPERTRIVEREDAEPMSSTSWLAWAGVGALLLAVVAVLVVSAVAASNDAVATAPTTTRQYAVGECVVVRPSDVGPVAEPKPCGAGVSGRLVAVVPTPRPCPSGFAVPLGDARTTLCLVAVD